MSEFVGEAGPELLRVGASLPTQCDVVIVGAGFSGLYMLHRLRQLGFDAHAIEAGESVGGTWYWNRYPGARCDVESIEYSYSFDEQLQQDWVWTERYAAQPEILRYLEHVADRFGLWSGITFDTRVSGATYDVDRNVWLITTANGAELTARYCIAAVGCLSATQVPDLPGMASFQGQTHHTGAWPKEGVEVAGKRVAVIGTGSSGIQLISSIASQVEHLTVFQRTPSYSLPARNRPLPPSELEEVKARYGEIRRAERLSTNGSWLTGEGRPLLGDKPEVREEVLNRYWSRGGLAFCRVYSDIATDMAANEVVSSFIRARIADTVGDPRKRAILTPRDQPFHAKRPCLDTGYYEVFDRPNVDIVDASADPITGLTPAGLQTAAASYDADVIIFATGYDAMTGSLLRLNITGRDGLRLADAWAEGPRTYLGLSVHGFPNFFMITGPGSPSVVSNMVHSIEQHVEWIADLLAHLRVIDADVVEAEAGDQDTWTRHVAEVGGSSLISRANSWYLGANTPGKPRVVLPYTGGANVYRQRCDEVAAAGYRGLRIGAHDPAETLSPARGAQS